MGDSANTVEVLVGSIGQDLGQTSVEIEGVAGSVSVHGLSESITKSNVGIRTRPIEGGQAIGRIVGIRIYAVSRISIHIIDPLLPPSQLFSYLQ